MKNKTLKSAAPAFLNAFLAFSFMIVFAGYFSGCASMGGVWDQADKVEVIDKVDSYKCKFIDVVVGSSENDSNSADYLFEAAMRNAKNTAAGKNATHVILQGTPQTQFDPEVKVFRMTLVTNAYHCKLPGEK